MECRTRSSIRPDQAPTLPTGCDAGLSFTYADTDLTGNAPAPVERLDVDRSGIFTFPDVTENRLAFVQGRASVAASDVWSVQVTGYFTATLDRSTLNGDDAEFELCDDDLLPREAPVNTLCAGGDDDDDHDLITKATTTRMAATRMTATATVTATRTKRRPADGRVHHRRGRRRRRLQPDADAGPRLRRHAAGHGADEGSSRRFARVPPLRRRTRPRREPPARPPGDRALVEGSRPDPDTEDAALPSRAPAAFHSRVDREFPELFLVCFKHCHSASWCCSVNCREIDIRKEPLGIG